MIKYHTLSNFATMAQQVAHVIGNDEVISSILISSSSRPLFGDGLGLDSIDALEIILILEKNYGVRLANSTEARPVFYSVKTLAEYVAANRK